MASESFRYVILLIFAGLHGITFATHQQNTLNVPQVLLPYVPRGTVHTNFTLKALQGCYIWLSNRPEVASVEPVFSDEEDENGRHRGKRCSSDAIVTAQTRLPERQMTEILAEEEVTGMVLRSDVFVDNIVQIEILTTTRELLLGEPPEVSHIQAFDTKGNVFSSLAGLEFEWELINVEGVGSVSAQSVIKFLPFELSSYDTSPEIYSLEAKGLRGSSVVVEPINTGQAYVRAKLKDRAFADVPPAQVKIIVLDNVMLRPGHDVYILVNTSIKYSVVRLRQGRPTVLPMPSPQFEFQLSNTTVGQLDIQKSSVLGLAEGYTKVTLFDKNMLHIQAVHQPAAGVYVVEPAYIGFSIAPHSNWVLEVGREYEVSVQIYDRDNRKVCITDNMSIKASFDEVYFKQLWSSKNGSYHVVRTLQKGRTILTAVYTSIKIQATGVIYTFDHPISGQQEAEIFDPVIVIPEIVVIPWHPPSVASVLAVHQYQYQLKPSGGSGSYIWTSSNTSVATVSTKGLVISTTSIGHTQVRAADMNNIANYGTVEVYFLPPRKMEFLPSPVEVQVGSSISLPLAVASCINTECRELNVFSDCRFLHVMYTLSDPSVLKLVDDQSDYEIVAGSCMSVKLLALNPGFMTLTVTYQYKDVLLKASVTVGAYLPLRVLDPVDVAVVSLCSTKNLMLEGGPLPWILDSSGYYEKVAPEKPKEVAIGHYHTADYDVDYSGSFHYFSVVCQELGEQVLTITIGNNPSPKNPYPASSSVPIKFACMRPASLTIVPDIKLPVVDNRQLSPENCVSSNKEVHVRNNQNQNVVLHLRDSHGRLFDNFTSLTVVWSSSDSSLAKFVDLSSSVKMAFVRYKEDENLRQAVSYQTVRLSDKMGVVVIRASIEGYECDILRWCGLELEKPVKFDLHDYLKLLLVPERTIAPPEASLLNHPSNQVVFHIKGGSGHFAVKGSNALLAKVDYQGKNDFVVIPHNEGLFTVTVHDMCLDSTSPAFVNIQVSDVYGINVVVTNKIELYSSDRLQVQLLDMFGVPLLLGNMKSVRFTPHFSPDILNIREDIKPGKAYKANQDTAHFTVRGVALGTASLTFTASISEKGSVTSEPKDIQVFAALRLEPDVVILIRGASFQVRSTGGPSPQAATMFSVVNHTVATVSTVGLVEAQEVGTTNVTGVVQAADQTRGQTIMYSKDVTVVHVVQLTGIKINVASTNLVTGTKISMYAAGLNNETPFTFGNAVPGLKFRWSTSNPDVCQVKSVYVLSGVLVESENDFRVDLHCVNPGHTTVHLKVKLTNLRYQQAVMEENLRDEVTFEVYERLQLLFPAAGFLLLPHNVNTRIKTNRDGSARMTYELITDCSQYYESSSSASVVGVSKNGLLTASSVSGTAVILVTVHEEFGMNQTTVVHVEVKPVSSLSITCQSPVRANSDKLQTFPLGMNVLFAVTLHDNIGRTFDVASIPLKYRLNRFDAVHIVPGPENGTLFARAMNVGEAILKVWDPSAVHIDDYIRIRVNHGLSPTKPTLLLGMVQQFGTSVISEGGGGVWSSSNCRVVNINSTTGVAVASGAGTATIYYKIPELYSAQTEVKVESLSYIEIIKKPSLIITNIHFEDGWGHVVPVTFGHEDISSQELSNASGFGDGILFYENLGLKHPIPFQCILNFDYDLFDSVNAYDVFDVKPGLVDGKPMCYIIPKDVKLDEAARFSESQLSVVVKVFDELQGRSISSESVTLPYVPAFMVSEKQIELSDDMRKAKILVKGSVQQLENLEVRSQDTSLVDVIALPSAHYNQAEYEIQVVGKNPESFKNYWVEFTSKVTMQHALVYVSYSAPAGGVPPVVLPCNDPVNPVCAKFLGLPPPRKGFKGLCLALLEETSAWIIGFSIFIGLIILLLIFCCTPRSRSSSFSSPMSPGSPFSRGSPGSTTSSPHGGTPGFGSFYGQGSYQASSGGTYPSGKGAQYTASTSMHSPGTSGADVSGRSRPEEHDEINRSRHSGSYYKRTMTTSRIYLSEDESRAPGGAMSLGHVKSNRSPGLFSVTQ